MSQVIIEFGRAIKAESQGGQVFQAKGHKVEELDSASESSTTIEAETGDIAIVVNAGTDNIWVRFDGTAAVGSGHFVSASTTRDFGPLKAGDTASVVNDS